MSLSALPASHFAAGRDDYMIDFSPRRSLPHDSTCSTTRPSPWFARVTSDGRKFRVVALASSPIVARRKTSESASCACCQTECAPHHPWRSQPCPIPRHTFNCNGPSIVSITSRSVVFSRGSLRQNPPPVPRCELTIPVCTSRCHTLERKLPLTSVARTSAARGTLSPSRREAK